MGNTIDVTDPVEPEEITFYQPEWSPDDIDVEGNFAFIDASNPTSLRLLDISDLGNIEEVGYIMDRWAYDIEIRDHYALVVAGDHLVTYDLSGAMGIPVPPIWTQIPDEITVTENDTIVFEVTAWDANDDEIELSMRRDNLPENAEFTDNGDGTGTFRWETSYDDAGEYEPVFVATAGEDEATHVVRIEVLNLNRAPGQFELIEPADRTVIEEFQAELVWQNAIDLDGDEVGNRLMLNIRHENIDTVFAWNTNADTTYTLDQIDRLMLSLSIYASVEAEWWVEASDGELSTESSSRRFITIPEVLSAGSQHAEIPTEFSLGSAYPNPFNLNTINPYTLSKSTGIRIDVFSITGRHVTTLLDGIQPAGYHSIVWSAKNTESGMYFIRMQTSEFNFVKKVIFLK